MRRYEQVLCGLIFASIAFNAVGGWEGCKTPERYRNGWSCVHPMNASDPYFYCCPGACSNVTLRNHSDTIYVECSGCPEEPCPVCFCAGRECGKDPCGNQCGTCPNAGHCFANGTCECQPTCERESRECGYDGCGGSCGTCSRDDASTCSADGQCLSECDRYSGSCSECAQWANCAWTTVGEGACLARHRVDLSNDKYISRLGDCPSGHTALFYFAVVGLPAAVVLAATAFGVRRYMQRRRELDDGAHRPLRD